MSTKSRVAEGAELFKGKDPLWATKVDVERFSSLNNLLDQIFGNAAVAMQDLGLTTPRLLKKHGLATYAKDTKNHSAEFASLHAEWCAQISLHCKQLA
mgnify:FL=1